MNNKVILGLVVAGLTIAVATSTFARSITQMGGNMMGQTNQQNHHGASSNHINNQHHRSGDGTHHADAGKFVNNTSSATKGKTVTQ